MDALIVLFAAPGGADLDRHRERPVRRPGEQLMDHLNLLSTSAEALGAEPHRSDLLGEAATAQRFRAASAGSSSSVATGPRFVGRVGRRSPAWPGPPGPTARTASSD